MSRFVVRSSQLIRKPKPSEVEATKKGFDDAIYDPVVNPAILTVLKALEPFALTFYSEEDWSTVVAEAGRVTTLDELSLGSQRVLEKAKFASRSEAGRFAAQQRWGHGRAGNPRGKDYPRSIGDMAAVVAEIQGKISELAAMESQMTKPHFGMQMGALEQELRLAQQELKDATLNGGSRTVNDYPRPKTEIEDSLQRHMKELEYLKARFYRAGSTMAQSEFVRRRNFLMDQIRQDQDELDLASPNQFRTRNNPNDRGDLEAASRELKRMKEFKSSRTGFGLTDDEKRHALIGAQAVLDAPDYQTAREIARRYDHDGHGPRSPQEAMRLRGAKNVFRVRFPNDPDPLLDDSALAPYTEEDAMGEPGE